MIETQALTKRFDDVVAVNAVDLTIRDAQIFGLLGTNGAGKSTLLRLMAGILRQDQGTLLLDGKPVFEAPQVKREFFYISDDQYFFANCNLEDMRNYYAGRYPDFDRAGFDSLLRAFSLAPRRRVHTLSKGMKKQLSLFLGLSANTRYLFCDETFDGLDPVARQAVKSLFADRMANRGLTPIIASHNLRELEDVCDTIGLLHRGGLLLSRELLEMRQNVHKVQAAFRAPLEAEDFPELEILTSRKSGRLLVMVVRGELPQISAAVQQREPIFFETLPLTLEEVFISETEVAGYEFRNLIV